MSDCILRTAMRIPKLGGGKVVVIHGQYGTGKILNNDGSFYNGEGEDYYIEMINLETARMHAVQRMTERKVEVLIYDADGVFVEDHRPPVDM